MLNQKRKKERKMRKLCLISKEIGKLLEKQLAHELKNYSLYKSFANFYGVEGLQDLEIYFNKRAEEEKNHSQWIDHYLTEADYEFVYPNIEANTEKWDDYESPFEFTVNREIETTQLIYKIYELAISQKDYMTSQWLLEFLIKEQIEEENISRMAMTIINAKSDIFISSKAILNLLKK